ncbi:hypothetical protein EJ02DRAFT_458575 [Clathrospora elynae]|uniref:FHA domain-containing protein n=1 Tax=Clathrospora elynae TaxID=706981 RepID=A0A6A5SCF0_9PLEO|nr:hypothetical protein EJ02DRAFT_458575 [Clathrospora elynae]
MVDVFRIVLRDAKHFDTYETREFDLPLNATFPIGRASGNATKRELMAAPHNAYINSPVISREHAVLSANTNSGTPEVYVSDCGSMHGSTLNGRKLLPNTPEKLSYGDVLQFGSDVNRNEEFFVARTYTFESRLTRPFSMGFTVPDAESEEDVLEHRGSQLDPLVIGDSESEPPSESDNDEGDHADVTMMIDEGFQQDEPEKSPSPLAEQYPESALRSTILEDDYSDAEGGALMDPMDSEHEEEVHVLDFDSEAESMGSSERSYESEPEVPDSEDEDMEEPANHNSSLPSTVPEVKSSVATSVPPTGSPTVRPRDLFTFSYEGTQAPELPRLGIFAQNYDSNSFADSISTGTVKPSSLHNQQPPAPPLPPRLSAPKSTLWSNSGFESFGQQDDHPSWYSGENSCMPSQPNYRGTNFGDRPSLFSPAPPPAQEPRESRPSDFIFSATPVCSVHQADRLQTPPLMPTGDVEVITPPMPGRRTKVTIEEIVEEVVEEQPPTPTSVNSMKRKADVLEEISGASGINDESVVAEDSNAIAEQVFNAQVVADLMAAQNAVAEVVAAQTAIIAQRPKKVPRSIISKVLGKAAYPLLGATGAVVSFALLSTLPDTFFV